jgi:hypothetical protein
VDPLEFLARLVSHIPEPGQVMQRYYGWYASRTRSARRRQASDAAEAPVAIVEPVDWSLRAARFRWAELLRRIFEVDPLTCTPPNPLLPSAKEKEIPIPCTPCDSSSRRRRPGETADGPPSGTS